MPGVGLTPTETPSKEHLSKALVLAKKSTASIGKFTEKLPKEKPSKYTGKKRKVRPHKQMFASCAVSERKHVLAQWLKKFEVFAWDRETYLIQVFLPLSTYKAYAFNAFQVTLILLDHNMLKIAKCHHMLLQTFT